MSELTKQMALRYSGGMNVAPGILVFHRALPPESQSLAASMMAISLA